MADDYNYDLKIVKQTVEFFSKNTHSDIQGGATQRVSYGKVAVITCSFIFSCIMSFVGNDPVSYAFGLIFFLVVAAIIIFNGGIKDTVTVNTWWTRDHITDSVFETIKGLSEKFRAYLLENMNNDITALTYTRLKDISEHYYYQRHRQCTREISAKKLCLEQKKNLEVKS